MAPPSWSSRPSLSTSASPIYGLHALGLPTRTLRLLPDEFIDGMGCRSEILGDVGGSAPDQWDRIWDYRPGGAARAGAYVDLVQRRHQS